VAAALDAQVSAQSGPKTAQPGRSMRYNTSTAIKPPSISTVDTRGRPRPPGCGGGRCRSHTDSTTGSCRPRRCGGASPGSLDGEPPRSAPSSVGPSPVAISRTVAAESATRWNYRAPQRSWNLDRARPSALRCARMGDAIFVTGQRHYPTSDFGDHRSLRTAGRWATYRPRPSCCGPARVRRRW
jgi:hypothetical protein